MSAAWGDIHLFLTIVRSGSLRSAAQALKVDVSTVSRRLASLELALGVRLLERTKGRLSPTEAGQQVLESGERVDLELLEMSRRVLSSDRKLSGRVRVSLPCSLTALVAAALPVLQRKYPQIELELLSFDALLAVDGQQTDIVVRAADAPPEHLVGQRVGRLAAAVYGARAYLKAHPEPFDHGSHAWIDWDRRLSQKPGFQWLDAACGARRIVARGLSSADVHALVRAGAGLAGLPCVLGDRDPLLRRLTDLPREVASSVWLLTHPDLVKTPRVRAVMSTLKGALGPHL